eukprot:TRINITY_DN4989_c1_g1_i1.p1 TRINITY_DN4989_c1_g1~~TRINITY_DN4989_c1_g1_i1.p1  ORF type:complete len:200 (+),score=33.37 TRINITY_DN4989_c1_g1_i1:74-601(+)
MATQLIVAALSIVQVRSVGVATAPVVAPAAAISTTALGSVGAGVASALVTKAGFSVGEKMFWAIQSPENRYVALSWKPFFTAMAMAPVVVGADADALTWDCWKPILHEKSTAPSRGRLLTDLLNDPVVIDVSVGNSSVFVRNRWNESWRIDPVVLPWGQIAAHATPSNFSAAITL